MSASVYRHQRSSQRSIPSMTSSFRAAVSAPERLPSAAAGACIPTGIVPCKPLAHTGFWCRVRELTQAC